MKKTPILKLPELFLTPYKRIDDPKYKLKLRYRYNRSQWIAISAPVAAIVLAVVIAVFYFSKAPTSFWRAESIKGTPTVGNEELDGSGVLPLGEWLKTDSGSKARIEVGMIGELEVDPQSSLQLLDTKATDHEVFLKKGRIYAKTWAPANLFTVKTPSATAIDLGCEYTLEVDKNGNSFVDVNSGMVALESRGNDAIVPQGAVCESKRNSGNGTPYFPDANTEFKAALTRYNFENGGTDALNVVLLNARKKDAVSLWNLLFTSKLKQKEIVFNRLAELIPPPANVDLNDVTSRNTNDLLSWWNKLGYGNSTAIQSLYN